MMAWVPMTAGFEAVIWSNDSRMRYYQSRTTRLCESLSLLERNIRAFISNRLEIVTIVFDQRLFNK